MYPEKSTYQNLWNVKARAKTDVKVCQQPSIVSKQTRKIRTNKAQN